MFPVVSENVIVEEEKKTAPIGKSFLFDFMRGDFETVDGKLIEAHGLDEVKIWIEKVLRTEKNRYRIYEFSEYGISLSDLVHSNYPFDFIKMEMEREIKETLVKNSEIQNVHSFTFERMKGALMCTFTVDTRYGQTGGEIKV